MTSKKQVRTALKRILEASQDSERGADSTGMYKHAYDRTIQRIEGRQKHQVQLAKNAIAWVSYALQPLRTAEPCTAIAIEIGEDDFDEDNVADIEDVVTHCAGLLVVDEQLDIVRLVHFTAHEYLQEIFSQWAPDAR